MSTQSRGCSGGVGEWQAAFCNQHTGMTGVEGTPMDRHTAARNLSAFAQRLPGVPVTNRIA